MRSSKNRSRSKGNRNRSVGNIVNRVFDSSGPEGKVRGTPQQIIDKYNQLARDAQLGNDRVAAENFQQHAEHYTRLLSEAQREMDARREQQDQQNNNNNNNQQSNQRRDRQDGRDDDQGSNQPQQDSQRGGNAFDDVIDSPNSGSEPKLVETPEDNPKPRRNRRSRRPSGEEGSDQPAGGNDDQPSAAAE
ncbi:DUF4167 domain-containing protein [Rhodobacterales bacterium HKCCE3408]|nr:DUF4167 domain-containing protein [Rhodobacterales bacterium HKCCE3408]